MHLIGHCPALRLASWKDLVGWDRHDTPRSETWARLGIWPDDRVRLAGRRCVAGGTAPTPGHGHGRPRAADGDRDRDQPTGVEATRDDRIAPGRRRDGTHDGP